MCLGEGFTPLLHAQTFRREVRPAQALSEDESLNPTGSFKARGMAVAVSMAKELGLKKLAAPSAGNAGGALAAYPAAAGMKAAVFMPETTPLANRLKCSGPGLPRWNSCPAALKTAARVMRERLNPGRSPRDWFDV